MKPKVIIDKNIVTQETVNVFILPNFWMTMLIKGDPKIPTILNVPKMYPVKSS